MPVYEFECPNCGDHTERFKSIARRDEDEGCPECGFPMRRLISGMRLIGATPSRPIDMTKQLGKVFDSNSEYRKYLAETPGVKEVDKASLRPEIDAIKDRKEKQAKRDGYRDWRHRTSEIRKKIALDGK